MWAGREQEDPTMQEGSGLVLTRGLRAPAWQHHLTALW